MKIKYVSSTIMTNSTVRNPIPILISRLKVKSAVKHAQSGQTRATSTTDLTCLAAQVARMTRISQTNSFSMKMKKCVVLIGN